MARQAYQYKSIADFPEGWRKVLFAVVSVAPRGIHMKLLLEVFEHYAVPGKEWDEMFKQLVTMKLAPKYCMFPGEYYAYLEEDPNYKHLFELTIIGRQKVLLNMREEDVCTSTFKARNAELTAQVRYYDAIEMPYDEYEYALRKMLSDHPADFADPRFDENPESDMIATVLDDVRLSYLFEGQKAAYFASLPEELLNKLVEYFLRYHNSERQLRNAAISLQECSDATDAYRIRDKIRFLDFLCEGDPVAKLAQMDQRSPEWHILQALILVGKEMYADAAKSMRKALKLVGSTRYFNAAVYNWFFGLVLYLDRTTPASLKTMFTVIRDRHHDEFYGNRNYPFLGFFSALGAKVDPLEVQKNYLYRRQASPKDFSGLETLILYIIVYGFHLYKVDTATLSKFTAGPLKESLKKYPVFAQIWMKIADPASPLNAEYEKKLKMRPLLTFEKELVPWEQALQDLIEIASAHNKTSRKPAEKKASAARMIYYFNPNSCEVTPIQQKSRAGGQWSSGKEITLKNFAAGACEGMTEQDRAVAATMSVEGSVRRKYRWLGGLETLAALVGHPHVYDEVTDEHREVIKGEVEISVKKNPDGQFVISTNVDEQVNAYINKYNQIPDGKIDTSIPDRITVFVFTETQKQLFARLHNFRTLPSQAEKRLATLMEQLAPSMPVFSDLIKTSGKERQSKQGDSKISLQISQADAGMFSVRAVVRPYAGSKITCEPGHGQEYLMAAVDGATLQVRRDLKAETANFKALEPLMEAFDDSRNDTYDWMLDTENCLELLEMVRANGKLCAVEWPEGEKLKVKKAPLTFSNVNLGIRRLGTWFDVTGTVSVDAKTRLKAAELLELVRGGVGNFIALGNDEYVALTEALKKQLSLLDRYSSGRGKKIELSIFNSGVLDDLEKNGAVIDADAQYRDLMSRIKNADQAVPAVPTNLKAELRDYQQDGFEWMMRLASWDAGALLADDMGLGKTVQTIAVLLERAKSGPQLVTVPASLLFNWKEELARFAPSLKAEIYNLSANRTKLLEDLGPGKVLIATYGVVSSDIDALAEIKWTTAVLDEAHNIKNKETKAFKAIVRLQADFRILLTGTPLQNHLTEIWALYEFAVPGLLGSFKSFSERFVLPIEKDHDKDQQRLLKRIVSPFILRRTKNDVLAELPEKTEITLKVELSDEERAIYEQLRQETSSGFASGEINPVQALAALLKLRQAACSAELVNPKLKLPSSKTEAFLSLCDDLMEGHHRALVFSQFTSHLALIKRELDLKGVEYLYLDGSMSSTERKKLVEQFENGETPLFLISLKAGGTGLNLTAADYVIHMDPWWNPAIEDQASDRAYRIGQERPVTIYRLIAEGTVEEKILKLHSSKKSLADALLEGTEMSSRLGREEIMELLQLAGS